MICHNKRITLKLREETAIEEMDAESKPIIYMIIALIVAVLLNSAFEAYADYKYSGYIHTSELFADALNGIKIDSGEGVIDCRVGKQLVKGIK